jgi:thiol-disulfide isomerase/thioredoxin
MSRVFPLSIVVLAIAVSAGAAELAVGEKAPEIKAAAWINSAGVTLAANDKKIVVVEFWATWCPPCRKSIPHLIEMADKFKDKGVVIVGLTDEPMAKVKTFATDMKMNYPVGTGSKTLEEYGVNGIPHAFIVVGGKIVWHDHPMKGLDKAIEEAIKNNPQAK